MTDPREVLRKAGRIAVVGFSTRPEKEAHAIPLRLLRLGYDVVPVHPRAGEIAGRRAWPRLSQVPGPIDVVDVFRPSAEAADVARQAVAAGANTVWLQLGIRSEEARRVCEEAGVGFVEDTCIWVVARDLPPRQTRD